MSQAVAQQPTGSRLRLPHLFIPREYQIPILSALDSGRKRAVWVVHRRGGKDRTLLAYMSKRMFEQPGAYYHFFPTYRQAKKVIWDGIDARVGRRLIDDVFPRSVFPHRNETELKITASNGAIYQLIGSDNFDSIMGTSPIGCVFSEYALQDPRAWDYIRPILAENGGWAAFIYTPRGRNHGHTLYEMARNNPAWFCERLTVKDTKREDGSPVIPPDVIEAERTAGMLDELIDQEFNCSFDAAIQGAYYGRQMQAARSEGRIAAVPWQSGHEVDTFWDLGVDDSMSVWFMQRIGQKYHFIDYYENSGHGLGHYAKALKERPYVYGNHYMPHDADTREIGSGEVAQTRREQAEALGIRPVIVVPRVRTVDIMIQVHVPAVRNVLGSCWFDEQKCSRGISALEGYRSEYDEEKKVLGSRPVHDWCSHAADAFRTFAVGWQDKIDVKQSKRPAPTGDNAWMAM